MSDEEEPTRFVEWLPEGVGIAFRGLQMVHHEKTAHQEVVIYYHDLLGHILVLNGEIQVTEREGFFYHEALVHPALSLTEPARVLIVGGGDGGALREVLRHPVREVQVVEIDARVPELARRYLAGVHEGAWSDPRVRLVIADAADFVRRAEGPYEAILLDIPDPGGPAGSLYDEAFMRALVPLLTEDGVLALQAGSPFRRLQQAARAEAILRPLFPHFFRYFAPTPAYPGGIWQFRVFARRRPTDPWERLARRFPPQELRFLTRELLQWMFSNPSLP